MYEKNRRSKNDFNKWPPDVRNLVTCGLYNNNYHYFMLDILNKATKVNFLKNVLKSDLTIRYQPQNGLMTVGLTMSTTGITSMARGAGCAPITAKTKWENGTLPPTVHSGPKVILMSKLCSYLEELLFFKA